VRKHLAASAAADAIHTEHPHEVRIPVSRLAPVTLETTGSLVERFQQALAAVVGQSSIVANETEAALAIEEVIEKAKARRIALSDAPLVGRVLQRVRTTALLLPNCQPPALFDCDLGITSAQWAVAETGTLVLESETERHRLASLVPPVHAVLIYASQIRQSLAEVLETLSAQGKDAISRTVTLITGPSRTSDIELTLAIGVHGPAQLHVVIIQGEHIG
jgi:L-lactate dehydrogenase complex protein LldG